MEDTKPERRAAARQGRPAERRLLWLCGGLVVVALVGGGARRQSRVMPTTSLRATTTVPESPIVAEDASSSSTPVAVDRLLDQWEEWKLPKADVVSGKVWEDSLPSLHHVWRMVEPSTTEDPASDRRLHTTDATTASSSTHAAVATQKTASPATKASAPHTPTAAKAPSTTVNHDKAPSPSPTAEPLTNKVHDDEEAAGKWATATWHKASEGAETAWSETVDEEHKLVAQHWHHDKNKTEGGDQDGDNNDATATNWVNATEHWFQGAEESTAEWFHNGDHWKRLGDHMRSWWSSTENVTAHESQDVGDWWNSTEHSLAGDERTVQGKFQVWWNSTSTAEKTWWTQTVHAFHKFTHQSEEKEALWWNRTREASKEDWDAVVSKEKDVWKKTVDWEQNVANETIKFEREVWNASVSEGVGAWDWTVDKEERVWKALSRWYRAHATYQEELGMPLVYFNTTAAFALLMNDYGWADYSQDFFHLQDGWDAQINQGYCAVATAAALLNSFPRDTIELPTDPTYSPYPYATQTGLISGDKCVHETVIHYNASYDGVFHVPGGLTLPQSKNLLKCYLDMEAYEVRMVHVDPSLISIDEVREDMRKALMDPTARIMVNVDRRAMGQIGGGHFSPLGSYVAREDSFLFMDVAKYKYPPVWVTAARLYASLATVDQCGSWDFPSGQDSLPHVDPMKVYRNRTLYAEMLKRVNCKETYRGYIIVRLKR
jgi:hypothetical protein